MIARIVCWFIIINSVNLKEDAVLTHKKGLSILKVFFILLLLWKKKETPGSKM